MYAFDYKPEAGVAVRLLAAGDATELWTLIDRNPDYLSRWQPGFVPVSLGDVRSGIATALQRFADGSGFHAGIWTNGTLAGSVTCNAIDRINRSADIGYWLGEDYQGQGLATLSCRALIHYLFVHLHLNRIEIVTLAGNTRSAAIPLRLGFRPEGVARQKYWLRDQFSDALMYSLLAADWQDL